jgi:hypothetical protein
MRKKIFLPFVILAAVLGGMVFTPPGTAASQELQDVRILNFPELQRVEWTVTEEEPIPAAVLTSFPGVTVSPVRPEDTTRLIHAGVLEADGFGRVVISLVAQARGKSLRAGMVGAILVPDEEPIVLAFLEQGTALVSLRVEAPAESGPPTFFASQAVPQLLGFPRYQVYLYNTTDTAIDVSLYAYLSNS